MTNTAYVEFQFPFSFCFIQPKNPKHSYTFQREEDSPFPAALLSSTFKWLLWPLRVYISIFYKAKQHGRLKAHSLQDNILPVIRRHIKEVGNLNANGLGRGWKPAFSFLALLFAHATYWVIEGSARYSPPAGLQILLWKCFPDEDIWCVWNKSVTTFLR